MTRARCGVNGQDHYSVVQHAHWKDSGAAVARHHQHNARRASTTSYRQTPFPCPFRHLFPPSPPQLVTDRIRAKFSNPRSSASHLLLFPEGTTTNNKFMMAFKRGAFIAGAPVQPLVLKYGPSKRFSPTWDAMPGGLHILLTLTELVHRVTVYQLPLYVPSEEERADPALYASNVREMMSKYGKIPTCELTYAEKLQYLQWVEATIKEEDAAKKGKGGKSAKAPAAADAGAGAGEEQDGARVLAGGRVDSGSLRVRVTGVTRKSMVDGEGAELGSPRSGGERVQVHAKAL